MDVLHIERLLYYRTWLFSGLALHARYDWSSFFVTRHCARTSTQNLKTTSRIWHSIYRTTTLLSKTFLAWLELHQRSNLRATAADTQKILWYMQHCVRILQARIYIANWHSTIPMTTKLTKLITVHTPNDSFTANDTSFFFFIFIRTESYVMT